MDKILIIDAHNFMWRANVIFKPKFKEAAPPKTDNWGFENETKKEEVNDEFVMVYNFFRNLRVLVEQFDPTKCFFVLEGHPQFRYDLYADYKANRIIKKASKTESHERFDKNQPEIVRLIKHLPITVAQAEHYEADDVVATLVDNMQDEEITIASNDSDYLQLLQKGYKNLRIYNPMKKDFMSAPEYHYIGWKSLHGDVSDNIEGLVGDKTAQKLLKDPEKFKALLDKEENRASFNINKQLIEFRPVPLDEIQMEMGQANFEDLREDFSNKDFKSMLKEPYWSNFKKTFDCLKY